MPENRLVLYAFAMSHGGKSLLWTGGDALALYVMIETLRLPPALAGLLFVFSSFWNAMLDGLWGYFLGRFDWVPRMLPGIALVAIVVACSAFIILPALQPGSVAMATIAMLLFRSAFALFDVPHNGLAADLALRHGHLSIARWRTGISAAGAIAIGIAAIPLLMAGAANNAGIVFAVLALAAFLLLLPLPWLFARIGQRDRSQGRSVRAPGDVCNARVREILSFCLAQMIGFAAIASMGKAILHIDILDVWVTANALLIISILRLGAVWFWSPIAARYGFSTSLTIAYLATFLSVLLVPLGIEQGPVGAMIGFSLFGCAMSGVAFLAWSRFSELLEQLKRANAPGNAAFSYSLFTATTKIALGLSGLLTGAWIARYSGQLDVMALVPLTILVALFCAISAGLAWRARPAFAGVLPERPQLQR